MKQELGQKGEQAAAAYLVREGFTVLAKNITIRAGEIDLLALAPCGTLVIVEVKTRASQRFGSSLESLSRKKQQSLKRTARILVKKMSWKRAWRIDLIGIDVMNHGRAQLRHIKNVELVH